MRATVSAGIFIRRHTCAQSPYMNDSRRIIRGHLGQAESRRPFTYYSMLRAKSRAHRYRCRRPPFTASAPLDPGCADSGGACGASVASRCDSIGSNERGAASDPRTDRPSARRWGQKKEAKGRLDELPAQRVERLRCGGGCGMDLHHRRCRQRPERELIPRAGAPDPAWRRVRVYRAAPDGLARPANTWTVGALAARAAPLMTRGDRTGRIA